jgi:hypothetical protein
MFQAKIIENLIKGKSSKLFNKYIENIPELLMDINIFVNNQIFEDLKDVSDNLTM